MVGQTSLAVSLLITLIFAGCVNAPSDDIAPLDLKTSLHPAVPGEWGALPEGPGTVRYVVNDVPEETRLFGFDLALNEADWGPGVFDWATTTVHIVPFGDLTSWAILSFEDGDYRRLVISEPGEVEVFDPAGLVTDPFPVPSVMRFVAPRDIFSVELVVALSGDGGLALRPVPGDDDDRPTLPELAQLPGGVPAFSGTGQGLNYAARLEANAIGVGVAYRATYGDVQVENQLPADTWPARPVYSQRVSAAPGLPGWASVDGLYFSDKGEGTWAASVTGEETDEFEGIFSFSTSVGFLLLGLPWFAGAGDSSAPVESQFTLTVTAPGLASIMLLEQLTLGTPVESLLGHSERFSPYALWQGIAAPEETSAPVLSVQGADLMLSHGGRSTTWVGAAPTV